MEEEEKEKEEEEEEVMEEEEEEMEEEEEEVFLTVEEQRKLCVGDRVEVFWELKDVAAEWCEGEVKKALSNSNPKTPNPNPKLN